MKLHIECLQEKLDQITKERDLIRKANDNNIHEHSSSIEKLNKIIKTLEEELENKAENLKVAEGKVSKLKEDAKSQSDRIRDLQK